MATKIDGNTIFHTRGDTLRIPVALTDENGDDYEAAANDSCRFALKKKYADEDPLIVQDMPITDSTAYLVLTPEQTKDLKFGEYFYDIEVTLADGTVQTIIPPDPEEEAVFSLTKEVY